MTVPKIVISWQASLVSVLSKVKKCSKNKQVWLFPALLLVELFYLYRVYTKCLPFLCAAFYDSVSLNSELFKVMKNQPHSCYR